MHAQTKFGRKILCERKFGTFEEYRNNSKEIVLMAQDVTEQQRYAEERRQKNKMQAIGALAGGVAHDFNNILTAMMGNIELLKMVYPKKSQIPPELLELETLSQRAAKLTSQLLMFSRKQVIKRKVLLINDVIENLLKMLNRLIGDQISIKFIPNTKKLPILADIGQIEQIILNLVVNARDAIEMHPKPTDKQITIKTKKVYLDLYNAQVLHCKPGEKVVFSIEDTGIGMSKETKRRIFEPFFTTKPEGKGTGLGLATVYGIVNQNKAAISVHSVPMKGSTFKIYWPISTQEKQESENKSINIPQKPENVNRILLVEDDIRIQEVLKKYLKELKYQVDTADDGLEAFQLIKRSKESYDLLISDIKLPKMNGLTLAEKFHKKFPEGKILCVTGFLGQEMHPEKFRKNYIHIEQKPYTLTELTRTISKLLM
jgi:signal transduction histidine kinase